MHKTDVGAVRLGLGDAPRSRAAFTAMHDALWATRWAARSSSRWPTPGVETIVGVTRDPSFGSLVLFGMGGVQPPSCSATPRCASSRSPTSTLTRWSARSGRSPLLFGYRGAPPVDVAALEDLLLRVGRLAERVPEVAEIDCNPVVVSAARRARRRREGAARPAPPGPPPGVRRMRDA